MRTKQFLVIVSILILILVSATVALVINIVNTPATATVNANVNSTIGTSHQNDTVVITQEKSQVKSSPTPTPIPTIKAGVTVGGVAVGNLNREAARSALNAQLNRFQIAPLTLQFKDKSWSPTLADLGITADVEGSLDKAFQLGTSNDANNTTEVPLLTLPLDEAKLKDYLSSTVGAQINQKMVEPKVVLGQDSGQLQITNSGVVGYSFDYAQTKTAILEKLSPQQNGLISLNNQLVVPVVVQTISPTITSDELYSLKQQVLATVSQPTSIHYADKTWKLDSKSMAGMLSLSFNAPQIKKSSPDSYISTPITSTINTYDNQIPLFSTDHLSLTLNRAAVTGFVTELAKGIDQKPQEGKLGWDNDHPIATTPSREGLVVDVPKSVNMIVQQLTSATPDTKAERNANLVVQTIKPVLDTSNLAALGLREVVGEGESHYGGSIAARGHNIETGAKYLTGTFIKPHSTFSFLDTVGDISEARGYTMGYSIVAGQTVPDVGGGICQVSTTTFRAAFFAGLPIVERHAHAYRVHWYEEMGEPVGFDAAVYQPGLDFRFANPYDTWLYLQAYTQNGYLHVRLFGTKVAGQTVEMTSSGAINFKPPLPDKIEYDPTMPAGTKQQLDYAQQGLDANIGRIVKINGVVTKTENFFSRFAAWGNIYKIGGTAPKKAGA